MKRKMRMPRTTAYLAGPIFRCSDAQAKNWRREARRRLGPKIRILDPMRRDFRKRTRTAYKQIVEGDKRDINRAAVVLVNADHPSWGTAMEIAYAFGTGRWVVAFDAGTHPSPWLLYHCTLFRDLATACRAIRQWAEKQAKMIAELDAPCALDCPGRSRR